jgi:pyrroline-5-carboxylate reductase
MNKVGIIGCGNLGKHLVKLIQNNTQTSIHASTKSKESSKRLSDNLGIETSNNNLDISHNSEILFLTTKPFQIKEICNEIRPTLSPNSIIVCTAAGINLSNLKSWLHPTQPIIRCMPNIPISVGSGIITFVSNRCVSSYSQNKITQLMKGPFHMWFNDENKIDKSTALSGCGPAFMSKILQYYIEAGMDIGLDNREAEGLVLSTMLGTINMIQDKDYYDIQRNTREIVEQVASKGGATEKGLIEFDKSDIKEIINSTIKSSYGKVCEIDKMITSSKK